VLTTLGLLSVGVIMVHSAVASVAAPRAWYQRVDIRHAIFAGLAAVVLCSAWRFKYHWLNGGRRLPFVAAGLLAVAMSSAALIFVPGIGHASGQEVRWARFGPREYVIGFQPSEILKFAVVIFLAAWLSRRQEKIRSPSTLLIALAIVGVCAALVITQDLGAALILCAAAGVTMLLAGVPWYYLAPLAGAGTWGFWQFVTHSPRHWARIDAMLNPWSTTNPCAYHTRQSLLAVLGGGWFGRGTGRGMQKLGFVPEDSTDFVFSVLCEEWGFIGAVLLAGLVLLWLWHAWRAAARADDRFGRVLAGSLGILIGIQSVLHVAVDIGAAPPTGISLPFVSAGGTALLSAAAAAALIVSVTAHRRAGQDAYCVDSGDTAPEPPRPA